MARRIAALAVGALALWPLVEPHLRVVRRTTVPALPPGSASLRILHLSDLHLLPRHGRRAEWIAALAGEQADLVVVTGDLWSDVDSLPLLVSSLGRLTRDGTPGVFVPGNNDYYRPLPPHPLHYFSGVPPARRGPDLPWSRLSAALEAVGWSDLTHRRLRLDLATPTMLTGTDDAHLGRDRYSRVAGAVDGFGIGVTHTPQRRVLDAMAADGHQLLLAGHTHGGQVRLPPLGAVVTNCDLDRARARGLSRYEAAWLHVSAGLGTSPYAPIRFCCRPEATLLTVVPVG
ncbi:MAG TPA: metallophosphoesterase [Mycobacteriales bacterium]|nr:metallophosphoesterase [Mycobacteriales bacterium]